eukprot:SAG31_NODE_932_length_10913_cov_3.933235_8_plen_108_part_00
MLNSKFRIVKSMWRGQLVVGGCGMRLEGGRWGAGAVGLLLAWHCEGFARLKAGSRARAFRGEIGVCVYTALQRGSFFFSGLFLKIMRCQDYFFKILFSLRHDCILRH